MRIVYSLIILALLAGCSAFKEVGQEPAMSLADVQVTRAIEKAWDLNPKIDHMRDIRVHLDRVEQYQKYLRKAVELHDEGLVEESYQQVLAADFFFPKQNAVKWLAEELEKGQPLSDGDFITFINRSDEHVRTMALRYQQHRVVAKDMKPGETRQVFAEHLPKGSVRLKIDIDKESDWGYRHGGRLFLSARFYGSEYGFTPVVVLKEDGGAAFE